MFDGDQSAALQVIKLAGYELRVCYYGVSVYNCIPAFWQKLMLLMTLSHF